MHKLCFFVPTSHLNDVKEAVFAAGAGQYEHYDRCCWETSGQGQFRALSGSSPYCGKKDQTHKVAEVKVETLCRDECLDAVVTALRNAHPYEEPAFEAWPVRHFPHSEHPRSEPD